MPDEHIIVKRPKKDWCMTKAEVYEYKAAYEAAILAGKTKEAEKIAEDWQQKAEEYRDYHRCMDILAGKIKYNPKIHKSAIFKENGVN